MDYKSSQNPFHIGLGDPEETHEHATPLATFTGLLDEFLLFGGPSGCNNQHPSHRSVLGLDNNNAISGLPDGTSILHTSVASCQQTSSSFVLPSPCPTTLNQPMAILDLLDGPNNDIPVDRDEKPRCWEHGCNGREFSSKSNLMRHMKEKSGASNKCTCPLCGAIFTRSSARDTHLAKQSCNKIRRYSNGRPRPSRLAVLENPRAAAMAAAAATCMGQDQMVAKSSTAMWDHLATCAVEETGFCYGVDADS
ncbi:hypothetical protein F5B22DRAFT_428439 [Xylaria bambusicola]|uniref:uncharacterized protein n=1 Tax=Xylaria bambusicola TaxID=326684 RepID=UPI0020086687|nr:uncharacterized protein F5B22DRAFT_428439 [Xylaria bambusicola]KAI0506927.1 hypothetical protein F5B22DRAFT_428439 [Xylaria bambusicola]